jgi:hypothetical protein
MKLTKSPTAAGVVTAAAFAASAAHIFSVVAESNSPYVSWVYPIGIDGLIFVGLRAMQTGRKAVGGIALGIGAAYSLMFNAHAEHAFTMPAWLIAAAMPICFFAAVLIETTASKEAEVEEIAPQIITKTVAPALLPIVPFTPKPVAAPKAPRIERPVSAAPVSPAGRTSGGRVASWDVEKAVALIEDGRTDVDVLATVDGLTAKPLQRTKRAVRLLAEDASRSDVEVATVVGQSAAHIARVRAAMKG